MRCDPAVLQLGTGDMRCNSIIWSYESAVAGEADLDRYPCCFMASGTSASSRTQGDLLCFLDLASPRRRNASLVNLESLLPIWSINRSPRSRAMLEPLFEGSLKLPLSLALICSDQILPWRHASPSILASLRLFDKAVTIPSLHSKPARTRVETLVARSFSSPSQVKFGG